MFCRRELKPCAYQASCRTKKPEVVGTAVEVTSIDLWGAEIFEVVEVRELGGNLARSEEELEGFSGEFDAGAQRIMGELFEPR